jgi:hypothetical protein
VGVIEGIYMVDIILFIVGIIGLIGGNLTVSKNSPVKGRRARITGAFLALSLPLSLAVWSLIFGLTNSGVIPVQLEVPLLRWSELIPSTLCILAAFIYFQKTNPNAQPGTVMFWLIAAIPAVGLYVAKNLTGLYEALFSYSMSSTLLPSSFDFRLEFPEIVIGFLIPVVITFIAVVAFPVITNLQSAILFALPVFILHIYEFSISKWILPGISSIKYPGDTPGAGYQEVINGLEYALVSLLLLVVVAIISWMASKIRQRA